MAKDFVWTHETARFRVTLHVEPEDMDPADSFEFAEDIEAVRNGDVEWFYARVIVTGPDGEELGSDSLGGCAYNSVREFFTAHWDSDQLNRNCSIMRAARGQKTSICHYFPSMVAEAISQARTTMARRADIYTGMRKVAA